MIQWIHNLYLLFHGFFKTMLSAKEIIQNRERCALEIPSFGVKDFEPDGSLEQLCSIQTSLSEIKNVVCQRRVKILNSLSQAVWLADIQLAEVTHQIGSYWTYMGHKIGQKLYIYPEEALYLLETGSLQIIYNGVSLSVQRAYFVLLGKEGNITVEKYRVYSLLSSCGYKVLRHCPKNTVSKYEKLLEVHKIGLKLKDYHTSKKMEKRHQDMEDCPLEEKKKVKCQEVKTFPSIYRIVDDSREILKVAKTIQSYKSDSDTNLNFDYDIYSDTSDKPFKKSCLQLPNFRVIIHRDEDSTFDVGEFSKLSHKYKDEVPLIHAIVFSDSVAFYKVNPVCLPNAHDCIL